MGNGPRDWTPPEPRDRQTGSATFSPSAPAPRAALRAPVNGRLAGLFAIALGLFACWWPLSVPAATADARGFAVTTAGVTALFLAARAGNTGFRRIAAVGSLLGLVGTALCVWSLVAFHFADLPIPPVPRLSTGLSQIDSEPRPAPLTVDAVVPRIVAPIEGADIASMPEGQLRANLRHIVFNLTGDLGYPQQQGALPEAISISSEGIAYYGNATLSAVPADMILEYARSSDGLNFTIRVSDAVSGMAVSADSATGVVVDE